MFAVTYIHKLYVQKFLLFKKKSKIKVVIIQGLIMSQKTIKPLFHIDFEESLATALLGPRQNTGCCIVYI